MRTAQLIDRLAKAHDTACYRYEMVGRKPMQRNVLAARKAEETFQTLLQQLRTRTNEQPSSRKPSSLELDYAEEARKKGGW